MLRVHFSVRPVAATLFLLAAVVAFGFFRNLAADEAKAAAQEKQKASDGAAKLLQK